jgi:hypothetical protein
MRGPTRVADRVEARYASRVDPSLVKRWATGHAAAGERALAAMRDEGPPRPEVAFAEAMDLLDLVDLAPDTEDVFREQEVARARAAWAKLRA